MKTTMKNALLIPWIPTTAGLLSPRETLEQAHTIAGLQYDLHGYEFSSYMRFLTAFAAVVIQEEGGSRAMRSKTHFSNTALDRAIERLTPGCNVFDETEPFLQLPRKFKCPDGKGEGTLEVNESIDKLSPSVWGDNSIDFWDYKNYNQNSASLEIAIQKLLIFYTFYGASNSTEKISGCSEKSTKKSSNYSPAIRLVDRLNKELGDRIEIFWHGKHLFESLLISIPKDWVDRPGLPAWADRSYKNTLLSHKKDENTLHPIWSATFSPNLAYCEWHNNTLVNVQRASLPGSKIIPVIGNGRVIGYEDVKKWNNQRKEEDSFYFYYTNPKLEDKISNRFLFTINFVNPIYKSLLEFHKDKLGKDLFTKLNKNIRLKDDIEIVLIHHFWGGTTTSPSLRTSNVSFHNKTSWLPQGELHELINSAFW